jgi:SAM-dependent methyltransferase
MFTEPKPPAYYDGCNDQLFRAVPPTARRVLEVGCGTGRFGAALKQRDAACTVFGIEREPTAAAQAALALDGVIPLDVQTDDPPLEPASLDAILYSAVLEHWSTPPPCSAATAASWPRVGWCSARCPTCNTTPC